jgi:hypothetical protein
MPKILNRQHRLDASPMTSASDQLQVIGDRDPSSLAIAMSSSIN